MSFEDKRRRMRITREIQGGKQYGYNSQYQANSTQINKYNEMSTFPPLINSGERKIIKEWKKDTGKETMIISFVSDPIGSNFYSSLIQNMTVKLDQLNHDYLIRQYPQDREYFQNCCFKPVYIQSIMEEYLKNVVWIDIDTNLKSSLEPFFNIDRDFDVGLATYTGDINGFVASPIFIRNTEYGLKMVKMWAEHCTEKVEMGIPELDHDALKHSIIPQLRDYIRIKLSNSDFHSGHVLENVNSTVPNKRVIMDILRDVNQHRPFNYSNKDFIIV